jgi:hypothetical protein
MLNEINRSEVRTNLLGWICPSTRVSLYFLPKIEECASLPPLHILQLFTHELDNSSSTGLRLNYSTTRAI